MRLRASGLRRRRHGPGRSRLAGVLVLAGLLGVAACRPAESELPPDRRLQAELGLGPTDRVHPVVLFGGATGRAEPAEVLVAPGDYLEFTTGDAWIHEILFEIDSLATGALSFMTALDQMASPPMVSRGSRFVVSFVDAPAGRYPYRVEGNGPVVHGVVVVAEAEGR